jgi:hypothetical protein
MQLDEILKRLIDKARKSIDIADEDLDKGLVFQHKIKIQKLSLGEEEIVKVLERNQLVQRFILEHDKDLPTCEMVDLLAEAISQKQKERME